MQKVGLTNRDIKKSVNSQVLTVFFAPLLVAGLHLCFVPSVWLMLRLFWAKVNLKKGAPYYSCYIPSFCRNLHPHIQAHPPRSYYKNRQLDKIRKLEKTYIRGLSKDVVFILFIIYFLFIFFEPWVGKAF